MIICSPGESMFKNYNIASCCENIITHDLAIMDSFSSNVFSAILTCSVYSSNKGNPNENSASTTATEKQSTLSDYRILKAWDKEAIQLIILKCTMCLQKTEVVA